MQLRLTLSILFLVLFTLESFSTQSDSAADRIFSLIYNQQFTEAEKLLEASRMELDPFYFSVLKLDLYWWKYSLSRSKTDAEKLNVLLDQLAETPENKPTQKICELIILSYKMRFEVKRKNYLKAFILKGEVADQLDVVQNNPATLPDGEQKLLAVFTLLLQYSDEAGSVFGSNSKKQACLSGLQKQAADNDWMVSS